MDVLSLPEIQLPCQSRQHVVEDTCITKFNSNSSAADGDNISPYKIYKYAAEEQKRKSSTSGYCLYVPQKSQTNLERCTYIKISKGNSY